MARVSLCKFCCINCEILIICLPRKETGQGKRAPGQAENLTARCWRVIHSNRNELNVGNEPRKLRPTCSLSFWLAGVGAGKKLSTWTEAARRKPVFAAGMHRTSKPRLCSSQYRRRLLSSEFLWDFKNPCGPLDTFGSVGQYYENRWLFNRVWDTQTRKNRKP